MLSLLIKPLIGVASNAITGMIETKKAKQELKITEIKATQKLREQQIAGKQAEKSEIAMDGPIPTLSFGYTITTRTLKSLKASSTTTPSSLTAQRWSWSNRPSETWATRFSAKKGSKS